MKYILSIDEGTTGTTALLLDEEGKPVAQGYAPLRSIHPLEGWVEQDPEEILSSCLKAVEIALKDSEKVNPGGLGGLKREDIVCIGITNQRETTVLFDPETGKPYYNAVVWQCRRTSDICAALKEKEGFENLIKETTGLVIDPYFSATKIMWILENVKGLQEAAERGKVRFSTVDSWLLYNLTGRHATDVSNASRTMLYDLRRLEWSEKICTILSIPRQILPEVKDSASFFGKVLSPDAPPAYSPSAKKLRRLLEGVPVTGIAGDQQAALFGHRCFQSGEGKCTFGTGTFLLMNTGESMPASKHGLITTIAWRIEGRTVYALEGSSFICGAAVDWLKKIGVYEKVELTSSMAEDAGSTDGVFFIPALAGLGAPWWNSRVRGAFFGLNLGTRREHLVRAVLESIAYSTAELCIAMEKDSQQRIKSLRADGGVANNNFLMQYLADILATPVERSQNLQATALGAAYLAALGNPMWKIEDIPAGKYQIFTHSNDNHSEEFSKWREYLALLIKAGPAQK
ncbi:MAG: glycerol kinase GlpK [Thermoplasmata archaeon]